MVGRPFPRGVSGNPNGRPLGSKHKLGEEFIAALASDFALHGRATITRVREEKPDQYLKVVASLLPRDVNLTVNEFEGMSDDDILRELRDLAGALAAIVGDGGDQEEVSGEGTVN